MYDAYSGIDRQSLPVTADFAVNGKEPGAELAGDYVESPGEHILTLTLREPVASLAEGRIAVRARDRRGNSSSVERTFRVEK